MASALKHAVKFLSSVEDSILKAIYFRYPPGNFLPALVSLPSNVETTQKSKGLTEILKESFVWAVPKRRRSVEKRRNRKFECGSYKEAGLLCPNCYARVKAATTEMQEAIEKSLGISPVENEVVVLYQNDKKLDSEFYQGKRIVEIKKDRPKIFCDNLLQKSTEGPSSSNELTAKKELS